MTRESGQEVIFGGLQLSANSCMLYRSLHVNVEFMLCTVQRGNHHQR
jgi:hypothetical protein